MKLTRTVVFAVVSIFGLLILAFPFIIIYNNSFAFAAPLTSVISKPTNNIINTVATYEVLFNTGTTGTVKSVSIAFPAGFLTTGAILVERSSNLRAGVLSVPSSNTLLYTIASPVSVSAGTPIRLEIMAVQNPNGFGSTFVTTITTKDASGTVIDGPTNSQAFKIKQIGVNDIANGAVTTAKMPAGAVTLSKLGSDVPKHLITSFRSTTASLPAGQDAVLYPECTTNEVVTGGGYRAEQLPVGGRIPPNAIVVDVFEPFTNSTFNGYVDEFINQGSTTALLTATVICATLTP